jgi:hypothetical protein
LIAKSCKIIEIYYHNSPGFTRKNFEKFFFGPSPRGHSILKGGKSFGKRLTIAPVFTKIEAYEAAR